MRAQKEYKDVQVNLRFRVPVAVTKGMLKEAIRKANSGIYGCNPTVKLFEEEIEDRMPDSKKRKSAHIVTPMKE